MMKNLGTSIVWMRRDLRISDNPALNAAAKSNLTIIPLYIFFEEKKWPLGGAGRWWLHHSLTELEKAFKKMGSRLIFRSGEPLQVLKKMINETGAKSVFWNRLYEPDAVQQDEKIKKSLRALNIKAESFKGPLLWEPWAVKNQSGGPYKVFTAYWKAVLASESLEKPLKKPGRLITPRQWPASEHLNRFGLLPEPNWAKGFEPVWSPGENGAQRALSVFLKQRVYAYKKDRDIPAQPGTSRLSPHLHFGEISPRQIWHAPRKKYAAAAYLRQIVWREFSHHLLFHFPRTDSSPMYEKFAEFSWKKNAAYQKAWEKGKTGYPIVDAGMRELWHTGWMHNRVRMIAASFLVKDLMIPWQEGARWFWDTLVDADLANNSMGWQWVAGCGADAAPFFRIFNPVTQSKKFDPQGIYIRRWIPELKKLDNKYIHAPWTAPENVLRQSDIRLGKDYAKPIVDHEFARRRALAAYQRLK